MVVLVTVLVAVSVDVRVVPTVVVTVDVWVVDTSDGTITDLLLLLSILVPSLQVLKKDLPILCSTNGKCVALSNLNPGVLPSTNENGAIRPDFPVARAVSATMTLHSCEG